MKPSIGHIVHFNSGEGPAAAVVIKVRAVSSALDLQVFYPNGGIKHMFAVEPGKHLGGWSWPPRD